MASDDPIEVPTIAEAPASHEGDDPADGVEAQLLLARARSKLLGWDAQPVHIGRYRVVERIGEGGMGVVYAAHDDELDRAVAIKILRVDLAVNSRGRQRLLREAQAIAKLSHPNVVHVYEVGQAKDQVFMAMELVRGVTLRRWCATHPSFTAIVEMFLHAGAGLAAAHAEGIIHRDFKPDNVLVGSDGRARVVDFGLARARADTTTGEYAPASASGGSFRDLDITRTGTIMGTPAYMAPEQLENAEPNARSDQFSFCASLFEALYGRRPFTGSTVSEVSASISAARPVPVDPARFGVPPAIHAAVLRGLSRDPGLRFADMDALLVALREGLAPPTGRGRPRWLIGALVGGLAAAGVYAASELRVPTRAPTPAHAADATPADPSAAIVDASDLPPAFDEPLPGDPTGVTIHRLANGLTIYVARRPLESHVSAAVVVRGGTLNEADGEQGLAQFVLESIVRGSDRLGVLDAGLEQPSLVLQHALIEAAATSDDPSVAADLREAAAAAELATADVIAPQEIAAATQALGGRGARIEAGPGVVLAAEIPRHRIDAWLELVGEAVQHPVFRTPIDAARVRYDELRRRWENTPYEVAGLRALATATGLPVDPERSIANIAAVPLPAARAYYQRWFRPNNAAIVLVGDIAPSEAVAMVEAAFATWQPAALPDRPPVDAPLTETPVVLDTEAAGPPTLDLAFALPPVGTLAHQRLVELQSTLGGPDGLVSKQLETETSASGAYHGYSRDFHVGGALVDPDGHAAAEARFTAALQAVAEDALPEPMWRRALAQAELDRLRWARTGVDLRNLVVDSFIEHRPWADVAARLATPTSRAEVVAATRELLARPRVVVRQHSGKLWRPAAPALPRLRLPHRVGRRSAFVSHLLDAPSTPLEPRFLVAGSHFEATRRGTGRVITAPQEGPMFRLQWVFPVGAAELPWLCDAVHAWVHRPPVVGVGVDMHCGMDDTMLDIVGPADRFETLMPELVAWLDAREMPEQVLVGYPEHLGQWRAENAGDPLARAVGLHAFALRGEHGLAAHLPDDAALRSKAARELPAAWAAAHEVDPDVLYAGDAAERLRALLPAPSGIRPRTHDVEPRAFRRVDHPTVLVLDDRGREDADVRVVVPWIDGSPRELMAMLVHGESIALSAGSSGRSELDPVVPDLRVRFSPMAPAGVGMGYRSAPADVVLALRTALDVVHHRLSRDEFAAAHRRFEAAFRALRVPPAWVPELVRAWGSDADDPRVAQWLALPSLGYADLERYYAALDASEPLISIAVDLEQIDVSELRAFGDVVVVDDPSPWMRDPMYFEAGEDAMLVAEH